MESLLDLIYPENIYCCCCGDFIDKSRIHGLCDSCSEKIDWTFKDPFDLALDEFSFSGVFTCCTYGFYPRKIIHSLKFSANTYVAKGIGKLMGERLIHTGIDFDLILPVPSAKGKKIQRGFNQAELLAEYASKESLVPFRTDILLKKRETKSMRMSSGDERRFMLKDAFSVENPSAIRDKTLVLLDDVVTTGSTAEECSRALMDSGAAKVYVLCFSASAGYDIINTP